MAHKKEASYFFHQIPFKAYPFTFKGVYIHSPQKRILLICGNGPYQSLLRVTALLNHLSEKKQTVKEIINFGLAGGLLPTMEILQIYQVSQVYNNNIKHCFTLDLTSFPNISQESCLSCATPIFNKEQTYNLNYQAGLLDMELWSIAYVCSFYGIKIRSFKLISDLPKQKETNEENVIKDSYNLSKKLYSFFDSNLLSNL